jgi:biopolymer transport protein ExbD
MKTKISISVLLIILITSLITVMGQEKTDKKKQEEDAKNKKEQVTIIVNTQKDAEKDLQKAMEESLAAEEKALKTKKELGYLDNKEFYKQAEALQFSKKKLQEEMKAKGENWDSHTGFAFTAPYRFQMGEQGVPNVYSIYGGDRENTSLSISKTLEEVTFSTDFSYDVKAESSNVSFFVSGTMKAGELKITLEKPDKTAFQEITISPLADVNWNQKFSWDDEESDEYLGKWIISISAAKATGNYRIQVNSR